MATLACTAHAWNAADLVVVSLQDKATSFAHYYNRPESHGTTSSLDSFEATMRNVAQEPNCSHVNIVYNLERICGVGSACERLIRAGQTKQLYSAVDQCMKVVKKETAGKKLESLVLCALLDANATTAQMILQEYIVAQARKSKLFSDIAV
jgi:hypothetical protein